MRTASELFDPSTSDLELLSMIPVTESEFAPRGRILVVRRGGFIDAPTVPALVMNGFDAEVLAVAYETGGRMSDPSVQLEGVRRHIVKRIEAHAARAVRRIDRMHRTASERGE